MISISSLVIAAWRAQKNKKILAKGKNKNLFEFDKKKQIVFFSKRKIDKNMSFFLSWVITNLIQKKKSQEEKIWQKTIHSDQPKKKIFFFFSKFFEIETNKPF